MPHTRIATGGPLRLLTVILPCLLLAACGTAPGGGGGGDGGGGGGDGDPEVTVTVSPLTVTQAAPPVVGSPHEVTFAWTAEIDGAAELSCVLSFGDGSAFHVIEDTCLGTQTVNHTYASFESPTTASVVVAYGGVSELRTVTLRSNPGDGSITDEQAVWLELVNLARSVDQRCGDTLHPAAAPVNWDDRVGRAAQLHSEYMAAEGEMTHVGPPGLETAGARVSAQGYSWTYVSENVAVGYADAAAVMAGWLSSPGHCRNIMNPDAEDVGMGYAEADDGRPYWTQNFARERLSLLP